MHYFFYKIEFLYYICGCEEIYVHNVFLKHISRIYSYPHWWFVLVVDDKNKKNNKINNPIPEVSFSAEGMPLWS